MPFHFQILGAEPRGILRMKFATLSQKDVDRAVHLINHRPRKRLGYLTPHEVFVEGKAIALQARM